VSDDKPTAADRSAGAQPGCKCGRFCQHRHGDQAEDAEATELFALRREVDDLNGIVAGLIEAQRCVSCRGAICPPMQCGACIEKVEAVPAGMPGRPVTAKLKADLAQANARLATATANLEISNREVRRLQELIDKNMAELQVRA